MCRHYAAAMAEHRAAPHGAHGMPAGVHSALVRRRSRRASRSRSLRRRLMRQLAPLFWSFCIIAVSVLLGALIARSCGSAR